jgi:hypothetical protein
VWEHSGLVEERIYLGGWEVYRKRDGNGNLLLERETLHGMDGARRVVVVETKTVDREAVGVFTAVSRSRFQLDNPTCRATPAPRSQIRHAEEPPPLANPWVRSGTGRPLLFAMVHLEWQRAIHVGLVGLCLGFLRRVSGSIVPSLLVHITFNALPLRRRDPLQARRP